MFIDQLTKLRLRKFLKWVFFQIVSLWIKDCFVDMIILARGRSFWDMLFRTCHLHFCCYVLSGKYEYCQGDVREMSGNFEEACCYEPCLPSQVSFGVSLVNILQKNVYVMMDDTVSRPSHIMMVVALWVCRHWSRSDVWWSTALNFIWFEGIIMIASQFDIKNTYFTAMTIIKQRIELNSITSP